MKEIKQINERILNTSNVRELRKDDDSEDTYTKLEDGPVHETEEVKNIISKNVTIVMTENRKQKEFMMRNIF